MKTTFVKSLVLALAVVVTGSGTAAAKEGMKESKASNEARSTVNVLVVGLDNVNSNYFPQSMITEETGIPEDSIGDTYSRIIMDNIIQGNKDKRVTFISSEKIADTERLVGNLEVSAQTEEGYADVSLITPQNYRKLLDEAQADYVLFLDQHYLKWQEKPLRTLFHFVSYSLYDKDQKAVTKGNNYFTCMNLEKEEKLAKVSRKSSSKIASAVVKTIGKE